MASTDFFETRLVESAFAAPDWLGQGDLQQSDVAAAVSTTSLDCSGDRYQVGDPEETRVLVADDHPQIRESISRMLSRSMNVVGVATNGQEAVEMAKRYVPQLILMDIRMPVMDGITATRLIHQDQPWIRIIGHSAYNDRELITEMIDAGAELFVLKGSEDLVPFLASL